MGKYTNFTLLARKDNRYDNAFGIEIVENGNRSIVALMNDMWICEEHGDLIQWVSLFKAAPELLEALQDLVCCPAFNGKVFEKDSQSHKAWNLARYAIAKALGKEE